MLTHRAKISKVAPTRLRLESRQVGWPGAVVPSSSGHGGGVRILAHGPGPPSIGSGSRREGWARLLGTMSCLSGDGSACTCPGQALPAIRMPRPPGPQALGSDSSTFDMRARPGQPASSLRVSVLKFTPDGSDSKLSPALPLCQARHHGQHHAITLTTGTITSIHGVTTFINSIITVITNIVTVISPCSR